MLPPRAWLIVVLLWFTVFSNYFARLLPTTMHDSIVGAIPMTEAQFGLLTTALLVTYGVMSPIAGFLADRFSRSGVIIISMISWSTITWLSSYARTFHELLILRSLMGLAEASYMPAALALISDYHTGNTRSKATGIHHTGYVLGLGLSGIGGWLAAAHSWHYAFSVVGLTCMAYSVLLALLLRDRPRAKPEIPAAEEKPSIRISHAILSLFRCAPFVLVFTTFGLLNMTGWSVIAWMPVFFQEHFHLSQAVAGLSATGYMNGAAVPGLFIGGVFADRWSRSNRRARMYVTAIGLSIAAPGILIAANTSVFVVAILGLILYRLAGSFYDTNTMPVLCEVIDSRYRATAYGLLNMVGSVVGGFGVYLSGMLRDSKIDLHRIFDVNATVCVVCALIFCFLKPKPGASAI